MKNLELFVSFLVDLIVSCLVIAEPILPVTTVTPTVPASLFSLDSSPTVPRMQRKTVTERSTRSAVSISGVMENPSVFPNETTEVSLLKENNVYEDIVNQTSLLLKSLLRSKYGNKTDYRVVNRTTQIMPENDNITQMAPDGEKMTIGGDHTSELTLEERTLLRMNLHNSGEPSVDSATLYHEKTTESILSKPLLSTRNTLGNDTTKTMNISNPGQILVNDTEAELMPIASGTISSVEDNISNMADHENNKETLGTKTDVESKIGNSNRNRLVKSISFSGDQLTEEVFGYLSSIVTALEQLNVLDSSQRQCYTVDSIAKEMVKGLNDPLMKQSPEIQVVFRIRQMTNAETGSTETADNQNGVSTDSVQNQTKQCIFKEVAHQNSSTVATDCKTRNCKCNLTSGINSTDFVGPTSGAEMANANRSTLQNGSDVNISASSIPKSNATGSNGSSSSSGGGNSGDADKSVIKPSRTQILVISTCAVVIGVFFTVALIMRIRNYIRRTRNLNKHKHGVRQKSPPSGSVQVAQPGDRFIKNKAENGKMNGNNQRRSISADFPRNNSFDLSDNSKDPNAQLLTGGNYVAKSFNRRYSKDLLPRNPSGKAPKKEKLSRQTSKQKSALRECILQLNGGPSAGRSGGNGEGDPFQSMMARFELPDLPSYPQKNKRYC